MTGRKFQTRMIRSLRLVGYFRPLYNSGYSLVKLNCSNVFIVFFKDWDKPENIPDPDAKKPDDWDDEMDGEWEPPMITNPDYKVSYSLCLCNILLLPMYYIISAESPYGVNCHPLLK